MHDVKIGDTILNYESNELPLVGYQEIKPNVFSNLYPSNNSDFKEFKK